MRAASPSVMHRSGSNVARASRPPIIGIVPMGLARISPSPRKHSATATTHTSARVTCTPVVSLVVAAHAAASCTLRRYSSSGMSTHSARNSAHASGLLAEAA